MKNSNLFDKSKPFVFITFEDKTGTHDFYHCTNSETGDSLSSFDNKAASLNDDFKWVKSVLRDIKNKAIITSSYASKHFS